MSEMDIVIDDNVMIATLEDKKFKITVDDISK